MASKIDVLLEFQRDLQQLNARFQGEIDAIESARLKRCSALEVSRDLVETAASKTAEAQAERLADRERATAGREQAIAAAAQKRRAALEAAERAWRRAEREAERARDDERREENRRHEDKTEAVDAILPMYKQALPREVENARHEKALARIQQDFDTTSDRAREDYQAAQAAALADELRATEQANDAEHDALRSADGECEETLRNVRTRLHDGLLKSAATRQLEEGFQQQLRDTRERWETEREALRARFKADYDRASAGEPTRARHAATRLSGRARRRKTR